MATYIYARVSTTEQTVDSQLQHVLDKYQGAEVVSESISGWKDKPMLDALIARLRRGDTLVVAGLDRLGRRAWKAIKLIEDLYARGINVISVREGIDYSTTGGRLITNILLSVAQSERDLISERTKAGMARARAEGKQLGGRRNTTKPIGRPKIITPEQVQNVRLLKDKGLTLKKISQLTNISTGRVCQLLKEAPCAS